MLRIPRSLETLFATLALWFFFGNPINVLTNGADGSQLIDTQGANSNFLLPGISMMISAIAAVILLICWKSTLVKLKGNPQAALLGVLLLIILTSVQWSGYPSYTLRRSILILGSTTFAVFLATRFEFREHVKMLTFAFCGTALLCFIFGLFLPTYSIMGEPHAGAWRGVHMHKNELGAQMGFISIFLLTVRSTDLFRGITKGLITLFAVCSVFLVVVSTSTTGLIILSTLGIVALLCNILRLQYRYMVPIANTGLAVAILAAIYMLSNAERILGFFGKGTDLTGRDELWPAMLEMAAQKPLFGYGYEGFWRGSASPGAYIWKTVGWPVPNAHNGFLDILLSVGYIGGLLFFISLLLNLLKCLGRVRITQTTCSICPVLALLFLMISNTTESTFFISDSWILYLWISLVPLQPVETQDNVELNTFTVSRAKYSSAS